MARSNFLMSRRRVIKVHILKKVEEIDGEMNGTVNPFAAFTKKRGSSEE